MGAQDMADSGGGEVSAKASRRLWLGIGIVILGALAAVGAWIAVSGQWKAWRAVAVLEGSRISRGELDEHITNLMRQGRIKSEALNDPVRRQDLDRFALEDMITRRLLLAEAERLKITVAPGEEDLAFGKAHGERPGGSTLAEAAKKAGEDVTRMREEVRRQLLMARLAEAVTQGTAVGDEEVAKYYEARQGEFRMPDTVRLRLLILDNREEAERMRQQAVKGTDFASLAREHSQGGARERGGDMGWVDPRLLPTDIAAAVTSLPDRGISPVIETKGGFYLVRVEGRQGPRQASLAEVKEHIRQRLTAERKQAKLGDWLQERRRSARIELYL